MQDEIIYEKQSVKVTGDEHGGVHFNCPGPFALAAADAAELAQVVAAWVNA